MHVHNIIVVLLLNYVCICNVPFLIVNNFFFILYNTVHVKLLLVACIRACEIRIDGHV